MRILNTLFFIFSSIAYNYAFVYSDFQSNIIKEATIKNCFLFEDFENRNIKDLIEEVSRFIPADYNILELKTGDLNFDQIEDCILVLKKNGEESTSTNEEGLGKRPLLILIRDKANVLCIAKRNDNLILCYECGGVMGDPFVEVVIKDNYFEIIHYGGSNWRWSRNLIFMFSKEKNEWFLNRDETESFHISNDKNIETKIKSIKDFGVVKFEEFNIYTN